MKLKNCIKLAVITACCAPAFAFATNGYFQHGYGVKSQGMAGVGIALPQDSLAAATNPAGMAFVGDRVDLGVVWFRPMRGADITGTAGGFSDGSFDGNDTNNFLIPEFGYNKLINPRLSLGVSVYGNGGMNTDYRAIPLFNGAGNKVGVDLMQLFIAPTVGFKLNDQHAIGLAVNFAYQKFAAKGLQNFAGFSSAPTALTDVGHDSSTGWGARVGWTGQLSDAVTVGATYQTKTYMGKFSKYAGLFAEQGGFDIPANFGAGIAVKAAPTFTLAFDAQKIQYSGVPSISNPSLPLLAAGSLGTSNGPGFGWRDMTTYKLGGSWDYSPALTLRAGVSYGRQPIQPQDALFNILAPGVIENHATLGLTWAVSKTGELSFSYMHGFNKNVNAPGAVPALFGGGNVNLRMYQNSFGIAYGWKL
jgi:long-chain fatty acid transport protein